jgi:hypothetical protein
MGEGTAGEDVAQALALEQLGDHEGSTVGLTDIVDPENIVMIERGNRTRFLLETPQAIGIGGEGSGQNFDGDVASQALITSAVDLSHSASANHCDDFVRSEFGTGSQGHEVCCIIA